MTVLLLILGIVLFFALVVIHEFGHFIMARRGGVEVQEFGIGFPPRIFKRRTRGGWDFSLNLLPIGGFVRLKGEHDTDTAVGSFGAAPLGVKTQIMIAGVTMNLIAAYVLLVILAFVGMPQLVDGQFTIASDAHYVQRAVMYVAADQIEHGSPAAAAGIQSDDVIVAAGNPSSPVPLQKAEALPPLTKQYAGQQFEIDYRHSYGGAMIKKIITLRSQDEVAKAKSAGKQEGYLGLSAYEAQNGATIIRSTWSAPIAAGGLIGQFSALTANGLAKAIAGVGSIIAGSITGNTAARQAGQAEASSQVAGPVGIFFVFKYGAALGIRFTLLIVALLSLTLAVMNILPIPALDGGRLWLMLITRALKRPLTPQREEMINATGFVFLMGLVILITIVDVKRFL